MIKFHEKMLAIGVLCCFSALQPATAADDKSRVPPVETYQAMLSANKEPGWIQFRNYDDKQLVYFTALQTLHCRLSEIRYSINSKELDQRFELVKCNPQQPFNLPPDSGAEDIHITLKSGEAATVAVQVVWEDGRESEIAVYEPCSDVGDQTCAWMLE